VPAAGPRALALAVYSDATGEHFEARETGVEGVACVDDAARAIALLHRLWVTTGNESLKRWAEGLRDFVLWMHAGDGLWHNFILDWDGARNADGPTSAPGINFWQARAMLALAETATASCDDGARHLLTQALDAADLQSPPPSDVRSVHALTLLALLERALDRRLAGRLEAWCEELAACRRDTLMNSPDELGRPHLWGHVQEAVLADASVVLKRPDLLTVAETSANDVFAEVIESGFDLAHVTSYDVESAVFVMDRLAAVTGEERYSDLAQKGRRWFDGRNPAGTAVYDRTSGRVADGIDHGRLSNRSGAEANVTACLALIGDPLVVSLARSSRGAGRP